MIAAEDVALVLLAAGQASRFPGGRKLEQIVLGRPVGLHVADALAEVPFQTRIVVTGDTALSFPGYMAVRNDDPGTGMADSIRLGVARAAETAAKAVLIALADMPMVTAALVRHLLDTAEGDEAAVAASDGVTACPPALFGRGRFAALLSLAGDRGARDLARGGRYVLASATELIDIDTPADLERFRALARA